MYLIKLMSIQRMGKVLQNGVERYQITQHKDSGIINTPNDWVDEIGNPRYILNLLLSIINVRVQTVDIVKSLPKLKF